MFENPKRGRQARNFTANVPKILEYFVVGCPCCSLPTAAFLPLGYTTFRKTLFLLREGIPQSKKMFNRTTLLIYISQLLVIVFLNVRRVKSPRNIDVFLIKCLVCSEELEETYKFCSRCGAAIDKEEVPYVIIFSVASLTRLFYSFWKSTMQWKYTLCLDTRQPGSVLKHTTYPAVWNYSRISTEKLIQSFWKL